MTTTGIIILSDPHNGGEEALGRTFNALLLARQIADQGKGNVEVLFQGAGTRWPEELAKPSHPAFGLYTSLQDHVVGACGTCADVFGATESVTASGVKLVRDVNIAGTNGVADITKYLQPGNQLISF